MSRPAAPDAARRRLIGAGILAAVLAASYPLVAATGRYSNDQLLTFYVLVVVALGCHFAEWWDSRPLGADELVEERTPPPIRRRTAGEDAAVGVSRHAVRFGWPPRRPTERPLGAFPFSATDFMRGAILFVTILLLLLGLLELLAGLSGQEATTGNGTRLSASDQIAGGALQTAAGALCLLFFFAGTAWVPGLRHLREDQPISWLAILVITQSFANLLSPTSGAQSVASTIANPTTAADLVAGSLPFGVIALLVVGPVVHRTPRELAERLGLIPLHPRWWILGLVVGVVLVPTIDWVFTPLQSHLLPQDCAVQQMQVQQSLAGGDTGRGIAANLAVALAAGIDEELLFRGVLLPRLGLVLSSVLFGAFHLQYTCHGLPSVGDLEIVVLGFVFGVLRIRGGLIAAILAHAAYDGSILVNKVAPGVSGLFFLVLTGWFLREGLRDRTRRVRRLDAAPRIGGRATPP